MTEQAPQARIRDVLRKAQHRGYKIVQFSECRIFKNPWDDEPLATVPSWDLAEEWVAKRIAEEKKAAQGKPAPLNKTRRNAT